MPADPEAYESLDLTKAEYLPRIEGLGFRKLPGQSDEELIEELQAFHGLERTKQLDRITQRYIDQEVASRVCGVPDRASSGAKCRWDGTNWQGDRWHGSPKRLVIEWGLAPGVSEQFLPSLQWAWNEWRKVLAIDPIFTTGTPAHVVYTHKRIDGPSGTLAWAQLPCGPDRQLESRMDASESWHFDPSTPPVRGKIHLGAVMCHENGHLLGLDHIPPSLGVALLNPTYRSTLLTPQTLDINEGTLRYGPAADVIPPAPAPPTDPSDPTVPPASPNELFLAIQSGESTYGLRLPKIR